MDFSEFFFPWVFIAAFGMQDDADVGGCAISSAGMLDDSLYRVYKVYAEGIQSHYTACSIQYPTTAA